MDEGLLIGPIDIYRGEKRETVYKEQWATVSSHLARHTFCTVGASRSLKIHEIAEIAGQNPKTTMRHYAGVIDQEKFLRVMKEMKFDDKKSPDAEHGAA